MPDPDDPPTRLRRALLEMSAAVSVALAERHELIEALEDLYVEATDVGTTSRAIAAVKRAADLLRKAGRLP